MRTILAIGLLTVCAVSLGQAQDQGGIKKPSRSAPAVDSGPVTVREATATFDRINRLFVSVLHIPMPSSKPSGSNKTATDDRPISRSEVIGAFMRLYDRAEPSFTVTPKAVAVDYPRLTIDVPSIKPDLVKLIQRGCIGGYGPLATGSKKTLTVSEFGDAVGFFLSRLGEMTHTSSTKWTPYLHSGD